MAGYGALFASALVAATLLPMQSEAVLIALLLDEAYKVWLLLAVATAGNVLGSIINWGLGRFAVGFQGRRWFPASPQQLARAQAWYQRWGRWSLLASWMPFIGDAITVMAGVLRERFWVFCVLVTVAKASRYTALAAITLAWV